LNTKIMIEALIPTGYTNERLIDHVRRVLPDTFRVFDIKVQQEEAEAGLENRRSVFGSPAQSAASSTKPTEPKSSKKVAEKATSSEQGSSLPGTQTGGGGQ
jgi:hypothetical protein